jgi:hypothetical protein
VAAKPLNFWELWGLTIGQAERRIFGKEAQRFFRRTYASDTPETNEPQKMPLAQLAAREAELQATISAAEDKLHNLRIRLSQAENTTIRPFTNLDYVKSKIGEVYELKLETETLETRLEATQNEHSRITSYLYYVRGLTSELKALPEIPPPTDDPPHAPLQISLLRNDDLLHEDHNLQAANSNPCLLRIIAGFALSDF